MLLLLLLRFSLLCMCVCRVFLLFFFLQWSSRSEPRSRQGLHCISTNGSGATTQMIIIQEARDRLCVVCILCLFGFRILRNLRNAFFFVFLFPLRLLLGSSRSTPTISLYTYIKIKKKLRTFSIRTPCINPIIPPCLTPS